MGRLPLVTSNMPPGRRTTTADDAAPSLVLRSVASRGLPEVIAEQIVEAIRTTPLGPGDRLPTEIELARRLGVGRTSVREAMRKLQTLGIVEVVRGRGAFVRAPATDDAERAFGRWCVEHTVAIEDLLEARLALECANAGLASIHATDEQKAELARINQAHIDGGLAGDTTRGIATDQEFHEMIAAATGNPLFAKLHAMLAPELTSFRRMTLAMPRVARRSGNAHQLIVEAIQAGDPAAARKAMYDHLWVLYEDVDAAVREGLSLHPVSARRSPPAEALGG